MKTIYGAFMCFLRYVLFWRFLCRIQASDQFISLKWEHGDVEEVIKLQPLIYHFIFSFFRCFAIRELDENMHRYYTETEQKHVAQ